MEVGERRWRGGVEVGGEEEIEGWGEGVEDAVGGGGRGWRWGMLPLVSL